MDVRTTPFRILVLCGSNSALSQMAEAIVETRGQKRPKGVVLGESAGIRPGTKVNEYAIVALMHHGIGWSRRETKAVSSFTGEAFDLVITLDEAAKVAAEATGATTLSSDAARVATTPLADAALVHWTLPDPTEHIAAATARAAFAGAYTALVARFNALLRLPLEQMDRETLQREAQGIHDGLVAPSRRSSARLRRPT